MKTRTVLCAALTLGLLAAGLATPAVAKQKETPKTKARITLAQAEKTIHQLWQQGKIKSSDLEEENGKLIYSFDIATPGTKNLIEAQIDAMTGKVISVEMETPADEQKEGQGKPVVKKAQKKDDTKEAKPARKDGQAKKQVQRHAEDEENIKAAPAKEKKVLKRAEQNEDDREAKPAQKEGKARKEIKRGGEDEERDQEARSESSEKKQVRKAKLADSRWDQKSAKRSAKKGEKDKDKEQEEQDEDDKK